MISLGMPAISYGQSAAASNNKPAGRIEANAGHRQLVVTSNMEVKSEVAQAFIDPLVCDAQGNLYLRTRLDGVSGIRRLNTKGDQTASFVASSAQDLHVQVGGYFSVTPDGQVYQLVYLQKILDRAVLVFNKDGSYKTSIKLDPGFPWMPTQVAPFLFGDLLVTGLKYDLVPDVHVKHPFTGIFSASGALVKEVTFQDDKKLEELATSGDSRVVSPSHPFGNSAIEGGQMEAAQDGNIYLMRRISPAIVYAISPGGEMVKRFTVEASSADYIPILMHIAGRRIAMLFREPQTRAEVIKVMDLDGRDAIAYEEPMVDGQGTLGSAFACYSENPERFTFLYTTDSGTLGIHTVEPR